MRSVGGVVCNVQFRVSIDAVLWALLPSGPVIINTLGFRSLDLGLEMGVVRYLH